MSSKPALVANHRKEAAKAAARKLASIFEANGVKPLMERVLAVELGREDLAASDGEIREQADLVLSLGGDGTILRSAHIVFPRVIPVLGVNLGQLGFLTQAPAEPLEGLAHKALEGDYDIQDRLVLKAVIGDSVAEDCFALNEFVVHHGPLSRTIRVELAIDGRPIRHYRADGVMVASPTGSTAYSLAAGGPLVEMGLDVLIITPVCSHDLAERAMVISSSRKVRLTLLSGSEPVNLVADGQVAWPLEVGKSIMVEKADFPFRLAGVKGFNHFQAFREKLGWGRVQC